MIDRRIEGWMERMLERQNFGVRLPNGCMDE